MKPYSVTIQMKTIEQYFHVVLAVNNVVHARWFFITLKSVIKTLVSDYSNESFPAVLSTLLHKLVLTFKSVDGTLQCDHLNKSY